MLILATGGTFEKDYDLISGQCAFNGSVLPEMIHNARLTCPHRLEILMQKDSLDMTISDRMAVLEACRAAPEEQIVIIHGTDTMTDTASFLLASHINKTIVLTGAMRPHQFGKSDASFNLGFALASVQHLSQGIYICMQGETFLANHVQKNRTLAQFVSTL